MWGVLCLMGATYSTQENPYEFFCDLQSTQRGSALPAGPTVYYTCVSTQEEVVVVCRGMSYMEVQCTCRQDICHYQHCYGHDRTLGVGSRLCIVITSTTCYQLFITHTQDTTTTLPPTKLPPHATVKSHIHMNTKKSSCLASTKKNVGKERANLVIIRYNKANTTVLTQLWTEHQELLCLYP